MAKDKDFDVENPYQTGPQLQREAMIAIILKGGSVVYKNRIITNPGDVPGVAELAQTDDQRARARVDVEAEIAKLQEQVAQLGGKTTTAEPGELPPVPKDAK